MLLGLLVFVVRPAPADAHAILLATSPKDGATLLEAPERVELTFSENVSPVEGGTRLLVPGDDPVVLDVSARNAVVTAALPAVPDDTRVVVVWRVASADGHPISGLLTFDVGDPAAIDSDLPYEGAALEVEAPVWVTPSLTVATAVWYVGLLLLAGAAFFAAMCAPGEARVRRRRLDMVVAAAAALGALLCIPLQAWRVAGDVVPDVTQWAELGGGRQLVAGLGSAALLPLVVGLARRPGVAAAAAVLALATPVLTGHSASEAPGWLMVGADVVHLAAGAVWFGGVVALVAFLRSALGGGGDPGAAVATTVVRRFSVLAAGSVAALAVTGTVMAWIMLPSFDALFSTSYGRLLIAKVALVAVPVGIAAWNRFHLSPGNAPGWDRLLRVVRGEASLLVAVVVVTGALVMQSPDGRGHGSSTDARSTSTLPPILEVKGSADGVVVSATVEPARESGTTVLNLDLHDDAGVRLKPAEPPALDVSLPSQNVGPYRAAAARDEDGYRATIQTPVPGAWQIVVGIRLSEFEQRSVLLRVTVS